MSTNGILSAHTSPITSYPGWSMELVDKETFKSWRIGEKLIYSLLIEAHHPGHKDGIPIFLELIENINKYIVDDKSMTESDTEKIFDIIIKENKVNLLNKVLNNIFLPNSFYNENIAKSSLKQAIRLCSLDVLNFMIQQNVTILSNDINTFDDIKSIIFNILRAVEMNKNNKNIIMTQKFIWNYLAKCFYHLYHQKINKNDNDNDKKSEIKWNKNIIDKYEIDNNDKIMISKYCKFFVSNPLIQYAIYKKIDASSIGKHYINKLLPILQFLCEHFMIFDDNINLNDLYIQCINDKLFDCSSLINFNIKGKNEETVKLFWSQYLTIKLIDEYLGINQFRKIKENEREKILNTIKYIISNGVGNNLENVIMIQLKGNEYINNKDIKNILNVIEYGKNVWNLKKLQKNEILSLFENICNKQIELPQSLCCTILSFIVL